MRLIDADELADYITENENDFLYALEHKDRDFLDVMIEIIPTAYDMNQVVDELEYLRKENAEMHDTFQIEIALLAKENKEIYNKGIDDFAEKIFESLPGKIEKR